MKIRSLSNILYFPLFIIGILILYFGYGNNNGLMVWIFVPVILIVAIYVGHAQIDYWWLKKNPAPLDEPIIKWLDKFGYYYLSLKTDQQQEYRNRLSNYLFAREFMVVANKEQKPVPEDIKAIIASQAINLTFGLEDYLLDDYDRIFIYVHAFPTPLFKFLHRVETEHTDKVIILTMDQSVHGVVEPKKYYNIALHAYADAFTHVHPDKDYPTVNHLGWEVPEMIFEMTKQDICQICGFENLDILVVHIVAFFTNKSFYLSQLPHEGAALSKVFNQ
ncbi:MAG TPA: hypothetical protein PKD18_01650 [Saprospiraceae bacterium]|nr:hypothetical protein [Saprospiraceae bacterium]HOY11768.1 hypothetical protein [Saprospiraceae bacterium]HPN67860.1 hypothetical protein [Saprospiraceae bacterium]